MSKPVPPLTVDDAWEHYGTMAGSASASMRQLAIAGIAIVWILATDNEVVPVENGNLRLPIFVFALSLALDLAQYLAGMITYWLFARKQESMKVLEFEKFPRWLNIPTEIFFIGKVVAVGWGYWLLVYLIWRVCNFFCVTTGFKCSQPIGLQIRS